MISQNEIAQAVGTIIIFGFLFVFFAGLYAAFYTAGKMFEKPWLTWLGYIFAVIQFASAMVMVTTDFLDRFWVNLVIFAALAYLVIPPAMWRVVLAFHRQEEEARGGKVEHAHFGP